MKSCTSVAVIASRHSTISTNIYRFQSKSFQLFWICYIPVNRTNCPIFMHTFSVMFRNWLKRGNIINCARMCRTHEHKLENLEKFFT
jgi:hypothetical protein